MGACGITLEAKSFNIKDTLKCIIEEDRYENGHNPYSGGIATICKWSYVDKPKGMKASSVDDYYLRNLSKRHGVVVNMGRDGWAKVYPVTSDMPVNVFVNDIRYSYEGIVREMKKPWAIVDDRANIVSDSNDKDVLIRRAKRMVMDNKFTKFYYVVNKRGTVIYCSYRRELIDKRVASTKDYLCLPVNKYYLIGWAAE